MNRELAELFVFVLSFVVLSLAAVRFGVDSREEGADLRDWS